jgi:plastocyanin
MTTSLTSHAGGISFVAFVIAVAVSIGYYQFLYVPQVNAKPHLPKEILEPAKSVAIHITPGSSNQGNAKFFDPKLTRANLGLDNKVEWTNKDTVPHTVTSDESYVDKISGPFNSLEHPEGGGYVLPGTTFSFVFTKPGTYNYHCEPHPWMKGTIDVIENFA